MLKRVHFPNSPLPYLLVAPQIIVTLVFFMWPAGQAVYQSFLQQDAFGFSTTFVGLKNYVELFEDKLYLQSFGRTILFSLGVTALPMIIAVILAAFADRVVRGSGIYRTLLIWPYAVAPVMAGSLWFFMFNPTLGIFPYWLEMIGIDWNQYMNKGQAMALVIMAASWKQIAYNFLFYLAAMQSIPRSIIEAAAIDGAGPARRFWTLTLPLISPTTFFLLVINVVYAFFETFGVIDVITQGGPAGSTNILVYKVYSDGFVGQDWGGSAAQSVILMFMVAIMTFVQFRFIERRVEY